MDAPEHRLFVFAAAGQRLAIGGKGDTHDFAAVTLELLGLLARRHVPEANHLIGAARGQEPAIGRKCQTPDSVLIVGKRADLLAGGDIPEFHLGTPITRRQGLAIR